MGSGVTLGVGLGLGVRVAVGVAVQVDVKVGVDVALGGMAVGVAVAVRVAVALAVSVSVADAVRVAVLVTVFVALALAVAVTVNVAVAICIRVAGSVAAAAITSTALGLGGSAVIVGAALGTVLGSILIASAVAGAVTAAVTALVGIAVMTFAVASAVLGAVTSSATGGGVYVSMIIRASVGELLAVGVALGSKLTAAPEVALRLINTPNATNAIRTINAQRQPDPQETALRTPIPRSGGEAARGRNHPDVALRREGARPASRNQSAQPGSIAERRRCVGHGKDKKVRRIAVMSFNRLTERQRKFGDRRIAIFGLFSERFFEHIRQIRRDFGAVLFGQRHKVQIVRVFQAVAD